MELLGADSASGAEEFLLAPNYCNFSSITEHTHDQEALDIVWWSNVVCLPLIALIGLSCNLLNIVILTTNKAARRIPSWTLLLALAVCDCLFLVLALSDVTPASLPSLAFSPLFNRIYAHSALYIRTLASTFYKAGILIVVAFNVERYVCVVYPLRAHRICTGRTSRMAVAAAIWISFLCSIQYPLAYEVTLCLEAATEQHFYVILRTESPALDMYYHIMDYVSLFAFNVLPIAALLVMNCRIIITLRRVVDEDSKRDEETARLADGALVQETSTQRLNANAILFAVVLMLLLCVGPQAPARLLFDYYGQYHSRPIVYTCITQQLVFLNASLNFSLYCVVSKRYRTLMRMTLKRLLHMMCVVEPHIVIGTRQSKGSSSAHATSMDDHSRHIALQPL